MTLPTPFSQPSATGVHSGQTIAQFEIGHFKNFVYLVLDWESRKAAIVDPQEDLVPLQTCLRQYEFQLECVLLTHTHFDHIAGLPKLAEISPSLPVFVHEGDAHRLLSKHRSDFQLKNVYDGQIIRLGKLEIRTIHTPGHSAGECCYFIPAEANYLLTGDTLFIRDCGRTDLDTGSDQEMFDSLQKIKTLPQDTIILPGHHYQRECASTLEKELRESPPLRCRSVEELSQLP